MAQQLPCRDFVASPHPNRTLMPCLTLNPDLDLSRPERSMFWFAAARAAVNVSAGCVDLQMAAAEEPRDGKSRGEYPAR